MKFLKRQNRKAFTLIELSIVLIIIGLLVAGIVAGSGLIDAAKISKARSLTKSSPVPTIKNLHFWAETVLEESFVDVVEEGSLISTWKNLSAQSSSQDATLLAVDVTPAIYNEDSINGLPTLDFAQITTASIFSVGGVTIKDGVSIFMVVEVDKNGASYQSFMSQENGSQLFKIQDNGTWYTQLGDGNNSGTSGSNIRGSGAKVLNLNYDKSINTLSMYLNGVLEGSKNPTLIGGASRNDLIGIGGTIDDAAIQPLLAAVGEVIIYSKSLSDLDRKEVEGYLLKKWDISI